MADVESIRVFKFVELRGDPAFREGSLVVAGKCVVGPIRVGDRFTRLVDSMDQVHDVEVGVLDIAFYGGYVLELEPTLAAELVLVGQVEPDLLVGATLLGCRERWARSMFVRQAVG